MIRATRVASPGSHRLYGGSGWSTTFVVRVAKRRYGHCSSRREGRNGWQGFRVVGAPRCRGSRDAEGQRPEPRSPATRSRAGPASPTPSSQASKFAIERRPAHLLDNSFGPGKLVARRATLLLPSTSTRRAQARSDRYREAVSRASLNRTDPAPELRVFWQDADDRWRSGRIIETNEHNDIYVRGHEWEGFVPGEPFTFAGISH